MVESVLQTMKIDSVINSHPIYVDVNNCDEINQIFDGITYGKVAFCLSVSPSLAFYALKSYSFCKRVVL